MGALVDGAGAARGRGEVRRHRHDLRVPEAGAGAVSRARSVERLSRRRPTRRTASPRRCCSCRDRRTAQQYGFNAIHLLPVNLYGPHDNFDPAVVARDSGADPQVRRGRRARRRRGGVLGHRQRDARVPVRRGLRRGDRAAPPSATTTPEPVNVGAGFEISIRDLAELIAELTGFTGRLVFDRTQARRPAAPHARRRRAPEAFGFTATTDFRAGLQRTIDWYPRTARRPA